MINTKSLISELSDVPRSWVFEFYLNLNEKLCGQDVKIKSPFNPTDKIPSMFIYFSKSVNIYQFKDFSTGKGGDGVTLVKELFNLKTRGEAAFKMMTDYNQFILNNDEDYGLRKFKIQQKYRVTDFKPREWTNLDAKYWTQFHIGSRLLNKYNVVPLASYQMAKEVNGDLQQLVIEGKHFIYGYFRADNSLYKIYQPMVKQNKFIKIRDYIQGTDQLTFKTKYLVICSSLKDVLALMKLGYKEIEAVAPDSENAVIASHVINAYRLKYEKVCTLFDNDEPGKNAMQKYKDKYSINGVILPMAKDLSDSIRDHGIIPVKEILTPLLRQALQ